MINKEYEKLKELNKKSYRLIHEAKKSLCVCTIGTLDENKKEYWIENKTRSGIWIKCKQVEEQPQIGFLSVVGCGTLKYTNEQWAKKCFIDYVNEQNKQEKTRIV